MQPLSSHIEPFISRYREREIALEELRAGGQAASSLLNGAGSVASAVFRSRTAGADGGAPGPPLPSTAGADGGAAGPPHPIPGSLEAALQAQSEEEAERMQINEMEQFLVERYARVHSSSPQQLMLTIAEPHANPGIRPPGWQRRSRLTTPTSRKSFASEASFCGSNPALVD